MREGRGNPGRQWAPHHGRCKSKMWRHLYFPISLPVFLGFLNDLNLGVGGILALLQVLRSLERTEMGWSLRCSLFGGWTLPLEEHEHRADLCVMWLMGLLPSPIAPPSNSPPGQRVPGRGTMIWENPRKLGLRGVNEEVGWRWGAGASVSYLHGVSGRCLGAGATQRQESLPGLSPCL